MVRACARKPLPSLHCPRKNHDFVSLLWLNRPSETPGNPRKPCGNPAGNPSELLPRLPFWAVFKCAFREVFNYDDHCTVVVVIHGPPKFLRPSCILGQTSPKQNDPQAGQETWWASWAPAAPLSDCVVFSFSLPVARGWCSEDAHKN